MPFCAYWDGSRIVQFHDAHHVRALYPMRRSDQVKQKVEHLLASPVDWWPLSEGRRSCADDHIRIIWNCCGKESQVDVPEFSAEEYRSHCKHLSLSPRSLAFPAMAAFSDKNQPNPIPLELITQVGSSTRFNGMHQQNEVQQGVSNPAPSSEPIAHPPDDTDEENVDIELYWCVRKSWKHINDMIVFPVKVNTINDDIGLFHHLNEEYRNARGRMERFLSWKGCERVKSMQFGILYDHQPLIEPLGDSLPPLSTPVQNGLLSLPRYEYILTPPPTVHMKIAARQIIDGIKGREFNMGSKKTLDAIPKHLFAARGTPLYIKPGLGWAQYDTKWGICTVQGYSLRKVLAWIVAIAILGHGAFSLWLVFVNEKDLHNASEPFIMVAIMFFRFLGIPEVLNIV
ncbi:hypothetical protein CC86DRAFT_161521 [Ophiobolus disseminans]|uniref:Uncharacterized protein n=1 Tax=Ophiobolus disseminans TaxID=1469910 RepID=A0A6A7ACX2_9PLEO|nr:hypothetical protein CC86DRAFT_161521 [Ophiobolus disseminans]